MRVELLAPAGNMEKLKAAINFGADAVYLSGKDFGLRAAAGNFSLEEMKEAFEFLRSRGKKGYITVNIYARNDDFIGLSQYLDAINYIRPDAIIVSDVGVIKLIRDKKIDIPIHISTQANTTNYMAVEFWKDMGVERVVLARELSRREIEFIAKRCSIDLEVFVHGAMCISYSGRCVLSNYFNKKDSNRGECTHPCRWKYYLMEESRPGEFLPIFEDERGSYIYNSKDLCLLEHIDELVDMGIKSFKIEGRMKSAMYVSIVTGVYRKAIDKALSGSFEVEMDWIELLNSVSNRTYTKGFYADEYDENSINYKTSSYVRGSDFLGLVIKSDSNKFCFDCRGKMLKGEELELVTPKLERIKFVFDKIYDINGNDVDFTKPNYVYYTFIDNKIPENTIIRRLL
ncbi:MAG: U32 family peptidase [Calditerrivibrio sp.]|nr:U32 family peptidase [Calditerrivibrio sp.]